MKRLFHFFAGVDESVFGVIGSDEKRFIRQIGFVQVLVFVFLVIAIFISFDYLTVERIANFTFDGELTITEKRSPLYEVIIGLLSLFVATMVVLLDRTLVMSDWYFQDNDETRGFKKVMRTLKRWVRIIPRVGISLFIAYTLTLFLLLRFYDTSLVNLLKEDYAKRNQAIVSKVDAYKQKLQAQLRRLEDEAKRLQHNTLNPPLLMSVADSALQHLNEQKDELNGRLADIRRRIDDITGSDTYRRWQTLQYRARCAQSFLDVEANSEDETPQTICGERYIPTGIPGEGPRFRTLRARRDAARNELEAFESAHPEVTSTLAQLQRQARIIRTQTAQLNEAIEQRRHRLEEERHNRLEELVREDKRRLHIVRNELAKHKESFAKQIEAYKRSVLKSAGFVRFEDGPLVRYIMLKRLFNDKEYGAERLWFSNMLKAMLIVIELMPLIMKVFFAPPGVYGQILQRRLGCMRASLYGESCADAFIESLDAVAKVSGAKRNAP